MTQQHCLCLPDKYVLLLLDSAGDSCAMFWLFNGFVPSSKQCNSTPGLDALIMQAIWRTTAEACYFVSGEITSIDNSDSMERRDGEGNQSWFALKLVKVKGTFVAILQNGYNSC